MIQKTASYESMSWAQALSARDNPKDPVSDIMNISEAELIGSEDTLEKTAQLAFNTPKTETKNEALIRASIDIQNKILSPENKAILAIKKKLSDNEVNPVELGVIKEADWANVNDVRTAEKIAVLAATKYESNLRHRFEQNANKPVSKLSSKFDPNALSGRVTSTSSGNDDSENMPSRLPAWENSILEPDRLDKYAIAENQSDMFVASIRKNLKDREAFVKKEKEIDVTNAPAAMNGNKVIASAAANENYAAFNPKTPKNQVSIFDTIGQKTENLSMDEMKTKLASLFSEKLEDSGESIRNANKNRKELIQGRKEKDNSWEKVQENTTVGGIQSKLVGQWLDKKE